MDISDAAHDYLAVNTDHFTPTMAQAVIEFSITDELKRRAFELGEKASEGTITEAEQSQLVHWIEIDELMSLMKAKAKGFLAKQA